ncbi:MAG: thiamine pyrophosphate-dependent enzyme [Microlunatus sp.]|nr:thiamine pyrophosphate-dependent enzyme [Microlunatus sp.]MDN5769502.1 thiamine pyrophosphate-dependent enzyme [Microlunatus sp.]MDN5803654.1 thiamine pyrophosphate-dependent enzyme [Microlunatus sp.]
MVDLHAGRAIVDSLSWHGVKRVFVVPGESYLAVLDGLYDSDIETVVCRQEGGAAYMAEAHGKLTGEPGVAMVTRGPGAANASIAVHNAWQDGTPLVLLVGLIPTAHRYRESFQEFDPHAWFGSQTKRVLILDEPDRASEMVAEAFFAARSGRPGPVVLGLPEDLIRRDFTGAMQQPIPVAEGAASAADLDELTAAIAGSQQPLIFVGGQRWTPAAAAALTRFAELNNIPVIQDWRAADRIPFDSPVNCGWLGYGRSEFAAKMLDEADVLVAVGAVLTDVPTDGYTLRQSPDAVNYLVTIDASLRGHSGTVTRHILASPVAFAAAIDGVGLDRAGTWDDWRRSGRAAQTALATLPDTTTLPATRAGTAHMSVVMAELVRRLPRDVVSTFGAGNHCAWAQCYIPTNQFPSQLSSRTGAMGYSIPAAVAAAKENPERLVVAICGDGEFLMNGQELATAVQYDAALLAIVMDNAQYGTIRAHQETSFPGSVSGTQLKNPDFAAYARAFGGHGETVASNDQAPAAVERALEAVTQQHRPALIHVIVDQQILVP